MRDVVFVAIVVAFFALVAAYVRGCGLIIGRDELTTTGPESPDEELIGTPAGSDRP